DVVAGAVPGRPAHQDRVDHVLQHVGAKLLDFDLFMVLGRHHDILDRCWSSVVTVAHGHLDLTVRTQIGELLGPAGFGQAARHAVCETDRQRHQLGGLVARVPEDHTRVPGAAYVDALGDVRRLLVQADKHTTGFRVEPILGARVADFADGLADDSRNVDVAVGR